MPGGRLSGRMLTVVLLVVMLLVGTVGPFITVVGGTNEDPDPSLVDVDIPDEITKGESFTVTVEGENDGGQAGSYSTITVSSPSLSGTDADDRVEVTDDSDHAYSTVRTRGDTIYDKDGDEITADYLLAEAGTDGSTEWDAGEERSFSVEFSPEESGTFTIYVRVTLTDTDSSEKFNAPESASQRDQQDFYVREYEVSVNEETREYELDADIDGEGGLEIDPPGLSTATDFTRDYEEGTEVELSARSAGGYTFDRWEGDIGEEDPEDESIELTMDQARSITATFEEETQEYELDAEVDEGGELEINPPGLSTDDDYTRDYEEGTEVELTADASEGYAFDQWEGDIGYEDSEDRSIEVTMAQARSITATFEEETQDYELDVDLSEGGGLSVYPPGISTDTDFAREYEKGTEVDLTAEPAEGYTFDQWEGNIGFEDSEDRSIEVTMDQARSITATFEEETREYELDADVDDGGGVEVDPPGLSTASDYTRDYKKGTEVELTAEPASGYTFDQWEGDIGFEDSEDRSIEVTMDEARSITATFEEETQEYELDADIDGEGGLEIDPPGLSTATDFTRDYEEGTEVELTADAAEGYTFDQWEGDIGFEDAEDRSIEVTMDQARSITAEFSVEEPDIDARITDVDAEDGTYAPGDTVPIDITVENTGDTFHEFYVDAGADGPEGDWHYADETTVSLNPGEKETTTLDLVLDSDVPKGTYDAGANVLKSNAGDKRYDNEVEFAAFTVESENSPPTATREAPQRQVTIQKGQSIEFQIEADDSDGNLNGAEWYIDDELDEETQGIGGSSDTATWTHSFDSAGTYTVEGQIFDTERAYSSPVEWTVVVEEQTVSAQVVDFDIESGEFTQGEPVEATAAIKNTGDTEHTFVVEYAAVGPGDRTYDGKGEARTSVTVEPGATRSVALSWTVTDEAPTGEYDAETTVWSKEDNGDLTGRLAEQDTPRAFEVVEADASLTVRVSDSEGTPIRGATVLLAGGTHTSSDEDGAAQFDNLDGGMYEITVSHDGYVTETATIDVEPGQQRVTDVTLARPEARITAVDGIPEAYQPGREFTPTVSVRNTGSSEATFELTMAEPSGIEIQGTSTRTVTLAPGAERIINFDAEFYGTDTDRSVQFELTTTDGQVIDSARQRVAYTETVLSVQVLGSAGGPVEGAAVSLLSNAETTRTDADGRVRVTSVTPGEHVVKVTPPGVAGGGQTATVDVAAGEETEATVRVERTGTVSGSVVNEEGEPLSGAVLSINGRTASVGSDGEFQFDGRFAAGTSYTVDVRRNGKSLYRSDIEVEPGPNDVQLTVSDDESGGWQLIDNANKGALLGEVGIQMGVPGSNTLEYHVGWLGLSMVPVADAPADIRDCLLAPNDDLATNGLDCGGAAASTVGSAGTIIGVITSPSGAGVAVAGGSFSLDTAEDITDAVKVSISLVRNVPSKVDEWAEVLVSKVGNQASRVVNRISDSDIAAALRKSIDKSRLLRAGFTEDEALTLIRQDVSASAATEAVSSGTSTDGVLRLADEGVQINRVSGLLSTRYSGKWSPGNSGSATKNFDGHYRDHADEFGDITKSQYRQQATELLNKREEVIVVYQKKGNMLVANPETGAVAIGNKAGEAQTYFKPDNGVRSYVRTLQNERGAVVVKETE